MPIYQFKCLCGAKGIITVDKDCESPQCPYCHLSLRHTEELPQCTDLNFIK